MPQSNANDLINDGIFYICPAVDENKVLDKISQTEVKLWNKNRGTNQKWKLIYNSNKRAYKIQVMDGTNLFLTWDAPLPSVSVKSNTNNDDQYWSLLQDYTTSDTIIRSYKNPNLVLQYNINNALEVSTQTNNNNQFFKFLNCIYNDFNNKTCRISTVLDNTKFLSKVLDGPNVVIWTWFDSSRQKWKFVYNEKRGAYKLFNSENNWFLTAPPSTNPNVVVYNGGDYDDQYWIINYSDNNVNQYTFTNLSAKGKILGVYNNQTSNNTNVQVFANGGSNQKWTIAVL
ncbi:main hemagglutinin component [Clostridium argentinense CDC 2741]|uniref:Main hemagglutinin component n=2 Tax=Clostridium argentinense TaxID=29341 RepID=A0A0C1TY77_9CLOT|nr:RICIN domain-containing protein [Clostridium argentinense]ARC83162.1 main hemagglutinin protein [Clostridium argentinense]KIE44303.1 main hemagglutinin component [Clostridium argentinense CDC 2741]BBB39292.1 hemagglutinin component HA33 [Clostridium argentinense]